MFGFLSSSCLLCDTLVDLNAHNGISLCQGCFNDLPWMQQACRQCGAACSGCSTQSPVCGACQKKPPPVDYTLSALSYVSPVNYLITQLKFHHQLSAAAILSELLYLSIKPEIARMTDKPDIIIPAPLHNKRLIKRGFNQAVEIARPLAKSLSLPLEKNAVKRIKNTLPQSELNASQRRNNIRGSFELVKTDILRRASHVVILDDVVTTGATCNELARVLKQAGVATVGVWSAARA